jgi:hypothetical protein
MCRLNVSLKVSVHLKMIRFIRTKNTGSNGNESKNKFKNDDAACLHRFVFMHDCRLNDLSFFKVRKKNHTRSFFMFPHNIVLLFYFVNGIAGTYLNRAMSRTIHRYHPIRENINDSRSPCLGHISEFVNWQIYGILFGVIAMNDLEVEAGLYFFPCALEMAAARVCTSSFSKMALRWRLTVLLVMTSVSAISLLVIPLARRL